MTARLAILNVLKSMDSDAADETLVAALAVVAPEHHGEIVRMLLDRGHEAGLSRLPPLLHKFDAPVRSMLVERHELLFGALRQCARSSNAQTRQNTLEIISESCDARLAYLAAHAIHDGSPRIRAEAARALRHLAAAHEAGARALIASFLASPVVDAETCERITEQLRHLDAARGFIVASLCETLEQYESHHRPEIVEAAMLYALDLAPSLLKQSTVKRGKLSHAIEEILTQQLVPGHAPFAYVALSFPEIRRKIVSILGRCRDGAFFHEMIRCHWLARDPQVRRNLSAIRRVAWLDDTYDATFNLPPDVAPAMPAWLLPLGIPVGDKISLLMNLLMVEDPAVHRAAAWALTRIDAPDATTALISLLEHETPAVRRIARIEIDRRQRTERTYVRPTALRARPDDWARLLESGGAIEEFESIWQNVEQLDPGLAQRSGADAMKFIPSFSMHLQTKLLSKNAADRLRALRIVQLLALGATFQKDVFNAANDGDVEIRATAVTTLGQIDGETSRRILERALRDPAPAVRCAGIESIEALKLPTARDLVEPMADSPDADVRTAAIRCLMRLRVGTAPSVLMKMLIDPRPDHRCAALWLVDQLKLRALQGRIRAIAEIDPDARIACIADRVARRLAGRAMDPPSGVTEGRPL